MAQVYRTAGMVPAGSIRFYTWLPVWPPIVGGQRYTRGKDESESGEQKCLSFWWCAFVYWCQNGSGMPKT